MRARAKRAKTTKGWGKVYPKSDKQRRELRARCGSRAFLIPGKLEFPVMTYKGSCELDCRGLRAAKARGMQMYSAYTRMGQPRAAREYLKAAKKAERLGTKAVCRWTRT